MKIKYSKKSLKFLAKQSQSTVARITAAIKYLTDTPPKGDIKPLQGVKGKMRLRIGGYRVIYYYISENEIRILYVDEIGNRGDIYK